MTKQFARPAQVAEYFSVSKQTIWRWQKEDGFPQPMKRGRIALYDIKAIEEWLQGGGNNHD